MDALQRVERVLDAVEINDGEEWAYETEVVTGGVKFRLSCELADTTSVSNAKIDQMGRWWFIGNDEAEDDSHILRTVWLAYQTFMQHEMLERFTYQGALPFNPHTEVAA